jgi:cell shape-determining protein MreC
MARVAPTTRSKILYFLCLIIGSLLLYIDINYKIFEGVKNNYKSVLITSSYLAKSIMIDPFVHIYELSKTKSSLIDQNKKLKRELDESYLSNFIISRETKFFSDNSSIEKLLDFYNFDKVFHLSEIKYFDSEQYFCCDQHRLFIQLVIPSEKNFIGSPVFNSSGIVGQVISDSGLKEVMLLSDSTHSLPVFSDDYFCNASGTGSPGLISCSYSSLIWPKPILEGQKFFSSGMGGIYPRNVYIGAAKNIKKIDDVNIKFDIDLATDPLKENNLAIIENK